MRWNKKKFIRNMADLIITVASLLLLGIMFGVILLMITSTDKVVLDLIQEVLGI